MLPAQLVIICSDLLISASTNRRRMNIGCPGYPRKTTSEDAMGVPHNIQNHGSAHMPQWYPVISATANTRLCICAKWLFNIAWQLRIVGLVGVGKTMFGSRNIIRKKKLQYPILTRLHSSGGYHWSIGPRAGWCHLGSLHTIQQTHPWVSMCPVIIKCPGILYDESLNSVYK